MPARVEGAKEIFMKLYVEAISPLVVEVIKQFGGFPSFEHISKITRFVIIMVTTYALYLITLCNSCIM